MKKQLNITHCQCGSADLLQMNHWQYFFTLSTLPVIVAVLISFIFEPIFFIMILPILFFNFLVAKRKTPMKVCRTCKKVS